MSAIVRCLSTDGKAISKLAKNLGLIAPSMLLLVFSNMACLTLRVLIIQKRYAGRTVLEWTRIITKFDDTTMPDVVSSTSTAV